MTDIGALCEKLYRKIEWQKMPIQPTQHEYSEMLVSAVIEGIQDLFVITGRALSYYNYSYVFDCDSRLPSEFSYTLLLDEEMFVLCKAQMVIFEGVRNQFDDMVGYTTNALTVANADKPYAYVTGTIKDLKHQYELYYYKMVRYSHL